MSTKHLILISGLFLQGCSTVCFIREKPNASNVVVLDMGFSHMTQSEEQAVWYEQISSKCDHISSYSNAVGTAIPGFNSAVKLFRINSKSSCLLKRSKNDALIRSGNLVVHGSGWHFEDGGSSYSSSYSCEAKFVEKVKAHNKFKNENASLDNA